MGSVKDLAVLKQPEPNKTGIGYFTFSDRYSVFDWGEMPNHITNKGKSLCIIGAYFFEKAEEMGIKTHYLGVMKDNQSKRLAELDEPTNSLKIRLLRVIRPEIRGNVYEYSVYQRETANFLIPLEVIYRNYLPAGSSVFRRLKEGTLRLEDLGLDKTPSPGQKLEKPILDVSTKLEATDRYINWQEAQNIAGLTREEVDEIKKVTLQVNELITKKASNLGLVHEDGKVEFGFDENRNLLLVDVVGTPDECRFTFQDIPVSKEVARIFYRSTVWYKELEEAKRKDRVRWKELVRSVPPPLPSRLLESISFLYQAFCNEITGRNWFETPALEQILVEIKESLKL